MIKRIVCVIAACIIVFWSGRIYSVNLMQRKTDITYNYDEIEFQGYKLVLKEAHIYGKKEFEQRFNAEISYIESVRVLCAGFTVTNNTGADIGWDEVMELFNCGFQTDTWASSISPSVERQMNIFDSELFKAGQRQEIWFGTVMTEASFKEKTWKNIYDMDYYYVFCITPDKIKVKLDLVED